MDKYYSITMARSNFSIAVFLICLGLIGCSAVGSVIPVDKRVQFSETGATEGQFIDGTLTVDYRYTLKGNSITVSGSVGHSGGMASLDIRLLFLDVSGTVLEQKLIYSSAYRTTRGVRKGRGFEKTLDVPPGTTGISFNASGQPQRGRQ